MSDSRTRPRVLFVTSWYPSRDRPMAGRFVREHARAVGSWARVTVLHVAGPEAKVGRGGEPLLEEDVSERHARGLSTWHLHYPTPPRGLGHLAATAWALWAMEQLWRRQGPFDAVFGVIFRAGLPAALGARRHGVPLLLIEHSSAVARDRLRGVDRFVARLAYGAADLVCPVSENLGRAIRRLVPHARIRTVGNAVDLHIFHPPAHARTGDEFAPGLAGTGPSAGRAAGPVRLLFVGRLHEVKGLDVLLRALSILEQDADTAGAWCLDLVGDGPQKPVLEKTAASSPWGDRIRFLGYLPPERVAEAMRQADLFVLPSRWENMPCVLLEAMATGLPVVATRVGGIPEVVGPEQGLLAEPEDAADLARALREALLHFERFDRDAIAEYGRAFGREAVGHRLLECLSAVREP